MTHAAEHRAAITSLVDDWLEMLDGVRENWGDEAAELVQDAYLLGRKVGFQEGADWHVKGPNDA